VIYEWDAEKATANRRKHRISFDEAATVFLDPLAMAYLDPDPVIEEQREVRRQVVFVSHCQRGDRVRIIKRKKGDKRRAQAI
jgi:uncharacterized DUF497 family protein